MYLRYIEKRKGQKKRKRGMSRRKNRQEGLPQETETATGSVEKTLLPCSRPLVLPTMHMPQHEGRSFLGESLKGQICYRFINT